MTTALAAAMLASPGSAAAQTVVAEGRALAPDGYLRVWSLEGSVQITGWSRDSVDVRGEIPAGARLDFGGTRDALKLAVHTDGAPADSATGPPPLLRLRVPGGCRLWVKSARGDVEVLALSGELDLYTVAGGITVRGSPSVLTAESLGGDIRLALTPGSAGRIPEVVRARSGGGSLELRGPAEQVALSTVSGSLTVARARVQQGRFETVDGPLRYLGGLEAGARLEMTTHAGPVTLELDPGTAGKVRVSSFRGEVESELGRPLPLPGDGLRGRELSLTLGSGGGAEISVRTFKGRIEMRRATAVARDP